MHEANETRADWAENALDTFTVETYGGRHFSAIVAEQPEEDGDAYTAVQDLIGDLLHVAARYGWNTAEILRKAEANFVYEADPGYEGD